MYVNKCTKCGSEFETKNPKRVICPDCLYPDKKMAISSNLSDDKSGSDNSSSSPQGEQQNAPKDENQQPQQKFYSSYSQEPPYQRPYEDRGYDKPRRDYNQGYQRPQQGGYNRPQQGGYNRPQQGGYNQDRGGYNRPPQQGGYNRPQGNYQRPQQGDYQRPQQGGYNQDRGGYNRPQGNYQRPQQGGYNRPQQGGYNRPQGGFRRPQNAPNRNKPLLINREQLEQIELLYKAMLPLPNPDAHEVIGEKIGLEPRKVFFGINLVRQKMLLPKLPFPKRKLAISPDQMFAIQNLYEPLLPVPPIGCHKIIASQLKMDEWRVHVGIGLIRAKLGLDRWNPERPDAPEEFRKPAEEAKGKKAKKEKPEKAEKEVKTPKEKKTKKAKAETKAEE